MERKENYIIWSVSLTGKGNYKQMLISAIISMRDRRAKEYAK